MACLSGRVPLVHTWIQVTLISAFQLLARSSQQATVLWRILLSRPPWWNLEHYD